MKKLFIGNLPYQSREEDLAGWFEESGVSVQNVNFIRDRQTGEPRGFGFVEVDGEAAAERAIQSCNGRVFQGRALVVNEARPAPAPRSLTQSSGFDSGFHSKAPGNN